MIFDRFKNAWDAFMNKDPTIQKGMNYLEAGGFGYNPAYPKMSRGNIKTIFGPIINRIALDTAQISFRHAQLDKNDRFTGVIDSNLNDCLSLSANIDQTGRAFIQDVVVSMFDEGCVAIIPAVTNDAPYYSESYKIYEMRTGKVTTWYPQKVEIEAYNQKTGLRERLILPKQCVCIIENPFYAAVNEPNSTLQRLVRTLSLIDDTDRKNSGNRLDLIVQIPFALKGPLREKQFEERASEIEKQLTNSPRGIAYIDQTEHVTQLNRSVDNQIMQKVEMYKKELYEQLGITEEVLNSTANEETMLNYYSRTIEPICSAIADEMKRKFLSRTAITQKQTIMFFRDPFKLTPIAKLADFGDKFITNEVMTSNEFRQVLGMKPSDSPGADELRNKHLNAPSGAEPQPALSDDKDAKNKEGGKNQNGI